MKLLMVAIIVLGWWACVCPKEARDGRTHKGHGRPAKTASGLEYWDIKVGTGAVAQSGQHVKVDYTGWLTTESKFDSSVGTGHPFEFMLGGGQVIKGWDEGRGRDEGRREAAAADSPRFGLWPERVSGSNSSQCNADIRCAVGGCEVGGGLTRIRA